MTDLNGAQALIRTLVECGVDTCFANPGTSEMHFVAALDSVPEMRAVLCLFEGVVTGAADGYGRIADKPAATLLHLGSGLGNGVANLHNARRAQTPILNIVGDHAITHKHFDAPLDSDIEAIAGNMSKWVRTSRASSDIARDAVDAYVAACTQPGGVATLILPADVSWGAPAEVAPAPPRPRAREVSGDTIDVVAKALRSGEPAALLIGGTAARAVALQQASRVAVASGAKLLCETLPARLQRGAGIPAVERLSYLGEFAAMQLDGLRHLVLVGARAPVTFFAYPGKEGDLVPAGCEVHVLAAPSDDAALALTQLADALGAGPNDIVGAPSGRPELPTGALNGQAISQALGALLPERAIVADESQTQGIWANAATAGAPPHDWMTLCGGAIGMGLPLATGAAIAAPDRPVVCFQADGSAMYTLQALWTQAREGLDVTTILLNNRSYAILNLELSRVGAEPPGPHAKALLDLSDPPLDFVALAQGMGVPASRATTAEEFSSQLATAVREPGPYLIDAILPASF